MHGVFTMWNDDTLHIRFDNRVGPEFVFHDLIILFISEDKDIFIAKLAENHPYTGLFTDIFRVKKYRTTMTFNYP
jgi:hypothetical protein